MHIGYWALIHWISNCAFALNLFHRLPEDSVLTKLTREESNRLAVSCGQSTFNETTGRGRQYPWAVSLTLHGFNKLGGAIISPYHILTVAHGFLRFEGTQPGACSVIGYKEFPTVAMKRVLAGSDCLHFARMWNTPDPTCNETRVQTRFIRSATVDHGFAYGQCVQGHDWAIIEVTKPFDFNENIAPICLPQRNQRIRPTVTAISWGRPNAHHDSEPMVREIPMAHDPKCTPPWSDQMPTKNPDYICAKSFDPLNYASKRTCHGDSGSGLQQIDSYGIATLVGLTSFGSQGCPPNELARFTRLSNYVEDICELTGICYTLKR